nr:MAG TPA: Minor capsid protein [Caudoviricetes sp.]
MIKGMTIKIIPQEIANKDPFGSDIKKDGEPISVDNVLIAPTSADEKLDALNLYGKHAVYTLGIPKGDTHNWIDQKVEFFGKVWRTFGIPLEGIEGNIPLIWNKKITVERYE